MQDTLVRDENCTFPVEASGYIWAYRLVLDRMPTELEINSSLAQATSPNAVARSLLNSREFESLLLGPERTAELLDESERLEATRWAFRLFMSREAGDDSVVSSVANGVHKAGDLRRMIALSEEFRVRDDKGLEQLQTSEVVKQFKPFCTTGAEAGSFKDFLGNTTRISFLPPEYQSVSGVVTGPPGSISNPPMHDASEWVGTLRAANEAQDSFTVVELGAGWAPWLVAGHKLAQDKGIANIHLVGVEGDKGHIEFMEQNFVDNGIDPSQHQLIYGVVGASDGIARFPAIESSGSDYGSTAIYDDEETSRPMTELPCYSLSGLLEGLPHLVDLIHCDIQGSEAGVMASASGALDRKVRRVVIGTHGRSIEGQLLDQFSAMGWKLEHETGCIYRQDDSGQLALYIDGVQVWRNPKV